MDIPSVKLVLLQLMFPGPPATQNFPLTLLFRSLWTLAMFFVYRSFDYTQPMTSHGPRGSRFGGAEIVSFQARSTVLKRKKPYFLLTSTSETFSIKRNRFKCYFHAICSTLEFSLHRHFKNRVYRLRIVSMI